MGATIREQFSDALLNDEFGIVTGSATAINFPDKPLGMFRLKARSGNVGSFLIGDYSNRCFWELDAGDDTGWVSSDNLNRYWYSNASGTSDYLSYWLQK